MNVREARENKLSKVLKHFLKDQSYAFTDAIFSPDEISEGYYVELVSTSIDYQTYFSNEFLDNNKLDTIIRVISRRLAKLRDE